MDFNSPGSNQSSTKKPSSKPAFGSPAINFGRPAVAAFGSPAIQKSNYQGYSHINRTPNPRVRPYTPTSSPGCYNSNISRDETNGFIRLGSNSPRNTKTNNRNVRNNQTPKLSDKETFKAPQNSPNMGRGMGRKSMTWTYGQSPQSGFHKESGSINIDNYYSQLMVQDPWQNLTPVLVQH